MPLDFKFAVISNVGLL